MASAQSEYSWLLLSLNFKIDNSKALQTLHWSIYVEVHGSYYNKQNLKSGYLIPEPFNHPELDWFLWWNELPVNDQNNKMRCDVTKALKLVMQ